MKITFLYQMSNCLSKKHKNDNVKKISDHLKIFDQIFLEFISWTYLKKKKRPSKILPSLLNTIFFFFFLFFVLPILFNFYFLLLLLILNHFAELRAKILESFLYLNMKLRRHISTGRYAVLMGTDLLNALRKSLILNVE